MKADSKKDFAEKSDLHNISRKNPSWNASYLAAVTNEEQVFILDLGRYILRFYNFYICVDCK